MKIICDKDDAARAIAAAAKIVNVHTTVPILTHVLISADGDGYAEVRATDHQRNLEWSIPCVVEEPGTVAVPAKMFAEYLAKLEDGLLSITASPTRTEVKNERNVSVFHSLDGAEYPSSSDRVAKWTLSVPAAAFVSALNAVRFAASSEEARGQVLMSVMCEFSESSLTLVATDGFRFARYQLEMQCGEARGQYMIPGWTTDSILRNVGASKTIDLSLLGTDRMVFAMGDVRITLRLVDGTYPNYNTLLGFKPQATFSTNRRQLLSALERVECLAGDRASMVTLKTQTSETLRLAAQSDVYGRAEEEIEIEADGADITFSLNARYFGEILRVMDDDRVILEIHSGVSPITIRPTESKVGVQQMYLLMPLRSYL